MDLYIFFWTLEDYNVSIIDLYEIKCIKKIQFDFCSNYNNIIQWKNKYVIATAGYSWEKKFPLQ